jgi:2'-5' RNA ligase
MRLFTGLDLPAHVSAALDRLLETLRPAARLRWTPVGNLHVTTKFIGEWPTARLDEMKAALATVPGRAPVPVAVRGLGWKPNPHSPRLFWAGVHAPALNDLARDLDAALAKLGVAPEQRAFTAHLTLARIGKPAPLDQVQQKIAGLPSTDFGSFEADRFSLYLSEPGSAGSVYTKLAEFPFAK